MNSCRIQPVVAAKFIDYFNRLTDKSVLGLITGHKSFGNIYDVLDIIPMTNDPSCVLSDDYIVESTTSHMKIFNEEMIIGYFYVSSDIPKPDASVFLHKFFNEASKSPLFIAAGFDGSFKINAYISTIEKDKPTEFTNINITYPVDTIDQLVLSLPTEVHTN